MFLLALALQLTVASDPVTVHGTTVITRSGSHEIVIAVDAAGDDSVDHLFRFWTEGEAPAIELSSRAATVEYRGDELVVTAADRRTYLSFTVGDGRPLRGPRGFSCTQMRGFGLNHETGPAVERKKLRDDGSGGPTVELYDPDYGDGGGGGSNAITCDSGGVGSSSCSITNVAGSCSTTCTVGYYACCRYGPENTCKCFRS